MHFITLDTNTWIYLANGTEPVRLLHFIKKQVDKGNITIVLPEIVIQEWDKNKDRTVKQGSIKHFNEITEALDRILKLLGDKGERDALSFLFEGKDNKDYFKDFYEAFKKKKQEVVEAINENIKLIDDLFKHTSTERIKIKDNVTLKAAQFALAGKAPFKKKNSFADALIMLSFIDYVEMNFIEGGLFISYNSEDFCEKKDGKKLLHSDLEPEFSRTKSLFYTIVGEALNTIEKNIVSKEELQLIKDLQNRDDWYDEIIYCEVCQENDNRSNQVYFQSPYHLIDERNGQRSYDPNQVEFDFSKNLPKSPKPKKVHNNIEVGHCEYCNTEHFICVSCGTTNAVWDNEYNETKECEGCGLTYLIEKPDLWDGDYEESSYTILKDYEICQLCSNKFENVGDGNNICRKCEDEYAYGD